MTMLSGGGDLPANSPVYIRRRLISRHGMLFSVRKYHVA